MSMTSEHGTLPLEPVSRPRGVTVPLLFAAMRRRYGLVPTAFRVLYARAPFLAVVSAILFTGLSLFTRIEPKLRFLLHIAVSTQNGCTFCADLFMAEAVRAKLGHERFRDLAQAESSSAFSEPEKAALAYAAALHRSLHIPDDVWSRLRSHFNERECVDIVWVCAVERYFNAMALPLRVGSDGLARRALQP